MKFVLNFVLVFSVIFQSISPTLAFHFLSKNHEQQKPVGVLLQEEQPTITMTATAGRARWQRTKSANSL